MTLISGERERASKVALGVAVPCYVPASDASNCTSGNVMQVSYEMLVPRDCVAVRKQACIAFAAPTVTTRSTSFAILGV